MHHKNSNILGGNVIFESALRRRCNIFQILRIMFDKYQLVIYIYTYYIIEFCKSEEQLYINSMQD